MSDWKNVDSDDDIAKVEEWGEDLMVKKLFFWFHNVWSTLHPTE
jgi:hypothetical protein